MKWLSPRSGARAPRRMFLQRFRELTVFGRTAVIVAVLLAGAGMVQGARLVLSETGDPQRLRREVRARLLAHDFTAARRALDALAAAQPGGLEDLDRWELEEPVRAGLERLRQGYVEEVAEHRRQRRYEAALGTLRSMRAAGLAADWAAYQQADVLREAGRHRDAANAFMECADRYPASPLADDALYWAGRLFRRLQMAPQARAAWQRLLDSYPSSTLRGSVEAALAPSG